MIFYQEIYIVLKGISPWVSNKGPASPKMMNSFELYVVS